MNRTAALVALLAVSIATGVWMLRPSGENPAGNPAGRPAACGDDSVCGTVVAGEDGEQAAEVPEAPAGAEPAPSPAPAPAAIPKAATPAPPPAPATPEDGKALRAEADRLIAEGRVIEGIETMRRATEADPSAKNHGDLGSILARLTAVDEALVHLRRAAQLDPGNADRWIALANAYYRAVNPGEAWKAEKRAREAEPGLVLGRDKDGMRVRQGDSEPRKP